MYKSTIFVLQQTEVSQAFTVSNLNRLEDCTIHNLENSFIAALNLLFIGYISSFSASELKLTFLLQNFNKLSAREPSCGRHNFRDISYTKVHSKPYFHPPRRGSWSCLMQIVDRWNTGLVWRSFFGVYAGCYCCWTLLRCDVSPWEQRKTYQ